MYFSGGHPGWTSIGSIVMKSLRAATFIRFVYSIASRTCRALRAMAVSAGRVRPTGPGGGTEAARVLLAVDREPVEAGDAGLLERLAVRQVAAEGLALDPVR